jgi:hypothetical protein
LTFAWQGFEINHPEDWAPALISGRRDEGYVRIASPEVLSYQVRWKSSKKGSELRRSLDEYLRKLERDARKLKVKFQSRVEPAGADYLYQWSGAGNGKGILQERSGRTFFLEASSTSGKSVASQFRELESGFTLGDGSTERWSAFGLALQLRAGLNVDKQVFQSGRTRIEWSDRTGKIVAERWGFGEQILGRHRFEDWAREILAMGKATGTESSQGWEFVQKSPLRLICGLAKFESEKNQIVTVKSTSRTDEGKARWDWLI